jgi:hypothetical protein
MCRDYPKAIAKSVISFSPFVMARMFRGHKNTTFLGILQMLAKDNSSCIKFNAKQFYLFRSVSIINFNPTKRAEGATPISPGQRPVVHVIRQSSPCRGSTVFLSCAEGAPLLWLDPKKGGRKVKA